MNRFDSIDITCFYTHHSTRIRIKDIEMAPYSDPLVGLMHGSTVFLLDLPMLGAFFALLTALVVICITFIIALIATKCCKKNGGKGSSDKKPGFPIEPVMVSKDEKKSYGSTGDSNLLTQPSGSTETLQMDYPLPPQDGNKEPELVIYSTPILSAEPSEKAEPAKTEYEEPIYEVMAASVYAEPPDRKQKPRPKSEPLNRGVVISSDIYVDPQNQNEAPPKTKEEPVNPVSVTSAVGLENKKKNMSKAESDPTSSSTKETPSVLLAPVKKEKKSKTEPETTQIITSLAMTEETSMQAEHAERVEKSPNTLIVTSAACTVKPKEEEKVSTAEVRQLESSAAEHKLEMENEASLDETAPSAIICASLDKQKEADKADKFNDKAEESDTKDALDEQVNEEKILSENTPDATEDSSLDQSKHDAILEEIPSAKKSSSSEQKENIEAEEILTHITVASQVESSPLDLPEELEAVTSGQLLAAAAVLPVDREPTKSDDDLSRPSSSLGLGVLGDLSRRASTASKGGMDDSSRRSSSSSRADFETLPGGLPKPKYGRLWFTVMFDDVASKFFVRVIKAKYLKSKILL